MPRLQRPLETAEYIVLTCPFAISFWAALGARRDADVTLAKIDRCPLPDSAPMRSASMLRLLCLWHLWKHRNGVVFNGLTPSLALARKNCRDDAVLWRARLPLDHRQDVDLWLTYLLPVRL